LEKFSGERNREENLKWLLADDTPGLTAMGGSLMPQGIQNSPYFKKVNLGLEGKMVEPRASSYRGNASGKRKTLKKKND